MLGEAQPLAWAGFRGLGRNGKAAPRARFPLPSEQFSLAALGDMGAPFGLCRLLVQPCDDLRHHIAAVGFNSAAGVVVGFVACVRDRQRGTGWSDALNLKMGNYAPLHGAIGRLDLDAFPLEAVGLGLLAHGQHPANT